MTGGTGGAEYQNAFAGGEMSAVSQSGPRRHSRIHHRCHGDIVKLVGDGYAKLAGGDAAFGEGTERSFRRSEINTSAILEAAYTIDAGNEWQHSGTAVVHAFCERSDNLVKRGGVYGKEHFLPGWDRLVEVL